MALIRPSFLNLFPTQRVCRILSVVFFFLCCCAPLFTGPVAHAAAPRKLVAGEMVLEAANSQFYVNLVLGVNEEEWLKLLLKDGAVIELGIDLSMERRRSWWANSVLAEKTYTFTLHYDQLTREFQFFQSTDQKPSRDRDLHNLLRANWGKLHLPLVPLQTVSQYGEDVEFLITAEITLRHGQTPPWLANSGLFWSSEIAPPLTLTLEYHIK